jgi:hypothetical protein
VVLKLWPSLLVRVVAVGESGVGGRRAWRSAVLWRCRVGLPRDPIRLCPVMSEPNIETSGASTMITGTFDPHLVTSAHDHENSPIRGRLVKFLA